MHQKHPPANVATSTSGNTAVYGFVWSFSVAASACEPGGVWLPESESSCRLCARIEADLVRSVASPYQRFVAPTGLQVPWVHAQTLSGSQIARYELAPVNLRGA
jgi:hypothetical protein